MSLWPSNQKQMKDPVIVSGQEPANLILILRPRIVSVESLWIFMETAKKYPSTALHTLLSIHENIISCLIHLRDLTLFTTQT